MSRDEYLKKEIIYSGVFILIGIVALLGFIVGFEKSTMLGLMSGFIPTGVGIFFVYQIGKKKPKFVNNLQLENEERNIFINTKAGHTAFWVSYGYICIAIILSNVINISMQRFAIFTLIFMPIVYFLLIGMYHKKY